MTVLLSRPYFGVPAGNVTELPLSTEQALIAQGLASNSAALVTTGNYTTNATRGVCAIAAAGTSVTITNPNVDLTSSVVAYIAQAAADTTLTTLRVVPAAGSFTIFGNAAATATVTIDWFIANNNPVPFN